MLYLVNRDQGVSVAGDDSFGILVFTLSMTGSHHREATIIGRLQHLKEILSAFDSRMIEALGWRAHYMISSKAG